MPGIFELFANRIFVFCLSFACTIICGPIFVPILKKLKFGQTVREDGPKTHLTKAGTPTMGGIIFLIPGVLIMIVASFVNPQILPILLVVIGFGTVGFVDDLLKILKKSKDGLSAKQKTIGLLLVAVAFTFYLVYIAEFGTDMILPFTKMRQMINIPVWLYILLTVITFYSTTNAVNLTDGVDGLASSVTFIVMIFFSIIANLKSDVRFLMLFSMVIAAGCLGFLLFNAHPAKVFMGDCGSLALGGAVAASAVILKVHWIILIVGIIYVAEAASVVIQVGYYKLKKKRVFKMAPIHHHFELSGWREKKVVAIFCAVTIIFSVIGMSALLL